MPYSGGANRGDQWASVMKWPMPTSPKKANVSRSSATRIPSVVSTEIAEAAKRATLIALSPRRRLVAPRGMPPGATCADLVPASNPFLAGQLLERGLRLLRLLGRHRDKLRGVRQIGVV